MRKYLYIDIFLWPVDMYMNKITEAYYHPICLYPSICKFSYIYKRARQRRSHPAKDWTPTQIANWLCTYLLNTVHFVLSLFLHFCVPEKTTRMYCPNNDTPWPNPWPELLPNLVEADDRRRDRKDPLVPDARSNRNSCRQRKYHRRTRPWIEPRHATDLYRLGQLMKSF